jgi:hypothetical protein
MGAAQSGLSIVHWTGTAKHLILGTRPCPSARFAVDHSAGTRSDAATRAPTPNIGGDHHQLRNHAQALRQLRVRERAPALSPRTTRSPRRPCTSKTLRQNREPSRLSTTPMHRECSAIPFASPIELSTRSGSPITTRFLGSPLAATLQPSMILTRRRPRGWKRSMSHPSFAMAGRRRRNPTVCPPGRPPTVR